MPGDEEEMWVKEYCEGCGYEIYRVPLSKSFKGLTFLQAAKIVYEASGSLLFALELNPKMAESRVVLNPGNFIIPDVKKMDVHAFVIAEDKKEAEVVSGAELESEAGSPDEKSVQDLEAKITSARSEAAAYQASSIVPLDDLHGEVDDSGADKLNKMQEAKPGNLSDAKQMWSLSKTALLRDKQVDDVDGIVDKQLLQKMYHYSKEPRSLSDATIGSVADIPAINGHVILIGSVVNLAHFVLPMRSRHLTISPPIVILHPDPPSRLAWSKLANFKDVWYVRGSAVEISDLKRVHIAEASRVVIFAKEYDDREGKLEALVDADTIFSYRVISRENPNIQIVGELVTPSNISFLHETVSQQRSTDHYLSPPFAAGHVYTASMLDTLVCQAFFNPHVITILSHIVGGCDPLLSRRFEKKMRMLIGPVVDSHLFQIEVPKQFHNKKYMELFSYLVEKQGILPLGLKRGVMKKVKSRK